jgi:hypothetical protein
LAPAALINAFNLSILKVYLPLNLVYVKGEAPGHNKSVVSSGHTRLLEKEVEETDGQEPCLTVPNTCPRAAVKTQARASQAWATVMAYSQRHTHP